MRGSERPEEAGISRYWRKRGGSEGAGTPLIVPPQMRGGWNPWASWTGAAETLSGTTEASLVNEESGEGILEDPRPPRPRCPTGSECRVSGGSRAWRRVEAAVVVVAVEVAPSWSETAGWCCWGAALDLASSGPAAAPFGGGGASGGVSFPAAPDSAWTLVWRDCSSETRTETQRQHEGLYGHMIY